MSWNTTFNAVYPRYIYDPFGKFQTLKQAEPQAAASQFYDAFSKGHNRLDMILLSQRNLEWYGRSDISMFAIDCQNGDKADSIDS